MLWVHKNHGNNYNSIYSVLQFLVGIALQLAQCNLLREAVVDVQPFPARQTTFQLRCRCKRTGPVFPTQVRMEMLRLDSCFQLIWIRYIPMTPILVRLVDKYSGWKCTMLLSAVLIRRKTLKVNKGHEFTALRRPFAVGAFGKDLKVCQPAIIPSMATFGTTAPCRK